MALSVMRLLPKKIGEITGGSILYDGKDILKASDKEMQHLRGAKMAMIFQDPMTSLNPVATVGDQILEVLELHFPEMGKDDKAKRGRRDTPDGRDPCQPQGRISASVFLAG